MIVVFTLEEEDFIAVLVLLYAYGARMIFTDLVDSASVNLGYGVVGDSLLVFNCVKHLFVKNGLESLPVQAVNRRFVRAGVPIHDGIPLVVPVDEVEIIAARWVRTNGSVLSGDLLFRWVGLLKLALSMYEVLVVGIGFLLLLC